MPRPARRSRNCRAASRRKWPRGVSKLMRNQDLILVAKKCAGDLGLSQHHRLARADERAAAAQSSLRRRQGHHRLDPRRHAARIGRRLHRHQSGQRRSGRDRRTCCGCSTASSRGCRSRRRAACSPTSTTTLGLIGQGAAGRPGVPVDRGHRGRQPQFWRRSGAVARRRARRGCRCAAAPSATM